MTEISNENFLRIFSNWFFRCTIDRCDAKLGCYYTPINVTDYCNDSKYIEISKNFLRNFNLDNSCTVDICDPKFSCVHNIIKCDDGNDCTIDSCVNGICSNKKIICDDKGKI